MISHHPTCAKQLTSWQLLARPREASSPTLPTAQTCKTGSVLRREATYGRALARQVRHPHPGRTAVSGKEVKD